MISLEQLQKLRELVQGAIESVRVLEQEKSLLQEKLRQYKEELDGLLLEKKAWERYNNLLVQKSASCWPSCKALIYQAAGQSRI